MPSAVISRWRPEAGESPAARAATKSIALPATLTFVAFALGVYRLGVQSLGFDEGFSVYVARMPLAEELRYLTDWDAHPPLHYFLLHFWIKLAGSSEFALRLSSVAFGVLLVPLVYQTGRTLAGHGLGLLAASLTASSPFLIYYSQQGRMYSLATLLSLLAVYLALRALRRNSRRKLPGLAAAVVLSLYTLYYTAFVLLSLWAVVLVHAWWRGRCLRERLGLIAPYLAVGAAVGLLYLPWLPVVAAQIQAPGPAAWRTFVAAPDMLWQSWLALSLGHTGDPRHDPWLWPFLASFGALLVVGAVPALPCGTRGRLRNEARHAFAIAATLLGLPLAAIHLASHVRPIYNDRYVIVLLPAYALLVAAGLATVGRRSRALLAVGALLVFGGQAAALYNFYYDGRYRWDDFRGAVRYLQRSLWPGDVVLLSTGTGYPVFNYYFEAPMSYRGPLRDFPAPGTPASDPAVLQIGTVSEVRGLRLSTPEDEPATAAEVEENLATVARAQRRVWYLRMLETITDRRGVVHSWLDRNLFELEQRWFEGPSSLQLYLYTTRRPPAYDRPVVAEDATVAFDNGIAIVGYELRPSELRPGEMAVLTVYWQARQPVAENYQTFAHLIDRNGQKWAQFDGPPLRGRYPTTRWQKGEIVRDEYPLRLPRDLPVGLYHFEVGLYNLATLRRISLSGSPTASAAALGELVIHPPPAVPSDTDRPALASIGTAIALQGFRLNRAQLRSGEQIELTLTWKALDVPASDYKVFVHIIGDDDMILAQEDSEPIGGAFPTSKWRGGDLIEDHHRLRLDATVPASSYRIAVGLYEPSTMQRLAVSGRSDGRVILGPFAAAGAEEN